MADELDHQRGLLLQKFAQVAATLRECADIADNFALFAHDASVNGRKRKSAASEDEDEEGDGKKKKRKTTKKIKDPNAPKRPPSSYILFQNEVRKELKAKYPDLPPPELVQMISKRWAAMSEDEKAPYNAITTAAKAAWVDKKGAYDAEHAGDAPIVAPPPRKRAPKAVAPKAAAKPVSKAAAAPKPVEPSTEDDDEEDEEEDEDDEEEEAPAKSAAKSAAASTSSGSEEDDSEEEQEEVVPPPKKKTAGRQPAPKAKEKKSKA